MNLKPIKRFCSLLLACCLLCGELTAAEIVGTTIIPHSIEASMRFRRTRDTELAARVQLFVKGPATATRFDGRTPNLLLIGAMKLRTSETVEDNHSTMTQYWLPWFLLCVAPENPEGAFRSP